MSFWHQAFKNVIFFEKRVKIKLYRKRTDHLLALFTMKDDLCFRNVITELFEQLEVHYDKTNWRHFIDASRTASKVFCSTMVTLCLLFP